MTGSSIGVMDDLLLELQLSTMYQTPKNRKVKIVGATTKRMRRVDTYLKVENTIPLSRVGVVVIALEATLAAVVTAVATMEAVVEGVGVTVMYSITVSVTVEVTASTTVLAALSPCFPPKFCTPSCVITVLGKHVIVPAASNRITPPKPMRALYARTSSKPSFLGGP